MNSFTDIQSFNQLFNEYYERFIRFAHGYVKERETAEDFVSEAFTQFWENRENLQSDTKPQAYILTIIKNKCLNHLQHTQVRQHAEKILSEHESWRLSLSINTLQACDPEFLFSEEMERIIAETLQSLPKKTRQIFVLNRFEGLSYHEIAEKMNLSGKTIEYHISRALRELRISLKDFYFLTPFLFLFC
jgi:RNA polymerase sigma-70 factor (ECF subfamily)